ncbi:DNA polymerase [Shewanella sp. 125m-1]
MSNRIAQHLKHLQYRGSIRVDHDAIAQRVVRYRKKKSKTSQHVAMLLDGLLSDLAMDGDSYWHRPNVSPYHTKTGRDTALGSSLNYVPKEYWPSILKPPDGYAYVLLDYQQQEPMIAAHLARCQTLLDWYREGDIYEGIRQAITNSELTRKQTKGLLIAFLYGISEATLAETLGVSVPTTRIWMQQVKRVTEPIGRYLDGVAREAKRNKEVGSLDWRYAIDERDKTNSLRNWKIQATGADIMRRACLGLDAAKIPLLLTNHDSFLVMVSKSKYDSEISKAIRVLYLASAKVLDGFNLKVSVEFTI